MSSKIEEIVVMVNNGLSYDKIGSIFGVSGACIRKILKKNGFELPKRRKINPKETFNKGKKTVKQKESTNSKKCGNAYCLNCGKELTGQQTKFCCVKCKNKYYSKEKYHTKYARKQDKTGTYKKIEYVKKMGGCCSVCGYKKNLAALVFHHLDPSKKKFTVGSREIARRSKESVEEELKNCIVLCQNCHHELHYPEYEGLLS